MKDIILCDGTNIEEIAQKARKNGFGIEIQAFHKPENCKNKSQINLHKKHSKGLSPIGFHAPFADLCPGSSDPMIRDVAKNRFDLGYSAASKLGVSHIVHHIGRVPGAGIPQRRAERCVNFWNEFLKGKSEDIHFHIENQFDINPEVLSLVIDGIKKNNVNVCLDIGHAHCHSDISVLDWIKILKDKIGYVHIHDNNGEADEHVGIGKGTIPMVEVLTALNTYAPDAIWALECKNEYIDESIARLEEHNFL